MLADGVLYARHGDTLYAFDARTGSARWSAQQIGVALSSPSVDRGVVYVVGDKIYAFDATTGAKRWSASIGPPNGYYGSPAIANGVVYVPGDNLYAFNAATGTKLWSAASTYSSPAIADGVVYVGGDKIYALKGRQARSAGPPRRRRTARLRSRTGCLRFRH